MSVCQGLVDEMTTGRSAGPKHGDPHRRQQSRVLRTAQTWPRAAAADPIATATSDMADLLAGGTNRGLFSDPLTGNHPRCLIDRLLHVIGMTNGDKGM